MGAAQRVHGSWRRGSDRVLVILNELLPIVFGSGERAIWDWAFIYVTLRAIVIPVVSLAVLASSIVRLPFSRGRSRQTRVGSAARGRRSCLCVVDPPDAAFCALSVVLTRGAQLGVAADETARGIELRCRGAGATIASRASARASRARTTVGGARGLAAEPRSVSRTARAP